MVARPKHAIVADGRVLIANNEAKSRSNGKWPTVTVNSCADFAVFPRTLAGRLTPAPRLSGDYMAFTGPSAIWSLGTQPRQIVQRCIHDDLLDMLEEAIQVDTPFGPQPFNLTTMQDFLPLGSKGFLTFDGLVVRVDMGREFQKLRSIEHYDSTGRLKQAWKLTGYPVVRGVFDKHVVGRMLDEQGGIDGIQLVEVEGLSVVNR